MRQVEDEELEPYLARLRELPFTKGAEIRERGQRGVATLSDAVLRVRTPGGVRNFHLEMKRTHLTYEIAREFVTRTGRNTEAPWILFVPHVGREMGRYLGDQGANYLDTAGNCRIKIGDEYFALIEGRPPNRPPAGGRGTGAPGHHVLFAILARPELLNAPVRTLAEAAGVGKTAAADFLVRLKEQGMLMTGHDTRFLTDPQTLLDRWLAGYATVVRPKLLVGRYRTQDPNPKVLEDRAEEMLGDNVTWGWGAAAAAMRLTGHYRGVETVLHVNVALPELPRLLRALPAEDGPITILRVPGKVAFEGKAPRTVHPLLIYTELLVANDPRAREAAQEIRDRFLQWNA